MGEKPTFEEVGQRWARGTDDEWLITSVTGEEPYPIAVRGKRDGYEGGFRRGTIPRELRYLGYSPRPAPAKGQRWRDTGMSPNGQQSKWYGGETFALTKQNNKGLWHDDKGTSPWCAESFTNGRLAFVDHGTLESPPPAPPPEAPAPKSAFSTRPASCLAEHWDETGPLSALTSIQARRSSDDLKPKEPWVPSCDIDCDIPDAGTSYTFRHPKAGGGR